jgi:hypothetical protein
VSCERLSEKNPFVDVPMAAPSPPRAEPSAAPLRIAVYSAP